MDYGYKLTEKELKELEKRITKEYETAEKEVQYKLFDYLQNFKSKDADMQAKMEAGKISQTEYNNWRVNQMATGKRWEEMRNSLAEDFHNTNNIAKEMTKEHSYDIYALNHNYGTYEIEKGAKVDTSYTLYNRATVERLVRDNPQMLPPPGKKVAERIRQGKDVLWNNQQIQSVMVQGLLQGMSIPELAERLAETVGDKDKVGAIRNARTMTTGAQNAGRVDSYKRAVDMGIKTKQRWIAVLDEKTRHSHRQLDGEMVDVGEKFSNGCRFPGDPSGAPEEVYNCRCAVVSAIEGTALAGNIEDLPRLSKIDDYEEWKKGKAPKEKAQEEKAKESEIPVERISEDFKSEFIDYALNKSLNEKIEFIGDYDPVLAFDLNTSFDDNKEEKIDDAILQHIQDTYTIQINGETYRNVDSSATEFMNNQMAGSKEDKELVNTGYCRNFDSYEINDALRNDNIERLTDEQKSIMDALDKVIEQNELKEDCHFVRYADQRYLADMLNLNKDEVQLLMKPGNENALEGLQSLKGTILSEKAYLSTSSDEKANIFNYKEVKLSIIAEKGTPAYFTNNKTESEVILGRDSKYIVEDVIITEKAGQNNFEFLVRIINE
jgi:SPP1 gp7 family putative phage head morphogenesis protein